MFRPTCFDEYGILDQNFINVYAFGNIEKSNVKFLWVKTGKKE